ncbi:DgyrCDS9027 [Dimorphilus gyrociliatus]|uniref:DgyrCDS9027 n=1 Tax=Dimorphilus gyrociliatus TaxID=2664684 RepID=A0A7I8VXE2_9ANNE|nr:DgyrCDS9027 [Dimorphilus gyrociliatus]
MAPHLNTADENFQNVNIFLVASASLVSSVFFIFACTKCRKDGDSKSTGEIKSKSCRQSNGQARELPQVPPETEPVEAVYTEVPDTVNPAAHDANIYECVPGDTPNQSGSGVVTGRVAPPVESLNGHVSRCSGEQSNFIRNSTIADTSGAPPVIPEKSEDAKITIDDNREIIQAVPPSRTGNICTTGKEPPYSDISARESLSSLREREAQQQILIPPNSTVYEIVEDQQNYDVIKESSNDYTTQIYSEINEEQEPNYDQVNDHHESKKTSEEVAGAVGGADAAPVLKRESLYSKVNKEKRKTAPPSSSNDIPIYSVVNKQRDRSLKTKSATPETLQNNYQVDGDYDMVDTPPVPTKISERHSESEPPYATVADSIEKENSKPSTDVVWQPNNDHIYQEITEKKPTIRNTRV